MAAELAGYAFGLRDVLAAIARAPPAFARWNVEAPNQAIKRDNIVVPEFAHRRHATFAAGGAVGG
jgi:hypothetical protein